LTCEKDHARAEMEQEPRGTGPTRRRSTCAKDRARAEMEQEQSKRDRTRERKRKQRDTASEESKAKEKESNRLRIEIHRESLVETGRTNVYSLCDSSDNRFAIFTAIPHPQHLAPTYKLHADITDIYLHISSARGILCACVFLVLIHLLKGLCDQACTISDGAVLQVNESH